VYLLSWFFVSLNILVGQFLIKNQDKRIYQILNSCIDNIEKSLVGEFNTLLQQQNYPSPITLFKKIPRANTNLVIKDRSVIFKKTI